MDAFLLTYYQVIIFINSQNLNIFPMKGASIISFETPVHTLYNLVIMCTCNVSNYKITKPNESYDKIQYNKF